MKVRHGWNLFCTVRLVSYLHWGMIFLNIYITSLTSVKINPIQNCYVFLDRKGCAITDHQSFRYVRGNTQNLNLYYFQIHKNGVLYLTINLNNVLCPHLVANKEGSG